jgi:hypothetical protein
MKVNPPNNFNPLGSILSLFPTKTPQLLTQQALNLVQAFLYLAGTICESEDEVLHSLKMLDTMGLIEMSVTKNNTIMIGNKYNGK